jgi:hypothetical protein
MKLRLRLFFLPLIVLTIVVLNVELVNAQARIVMGTTSAVYMRMSGGTQTTPICLVVDNAAATAFTCGAAGAACPSSGSVSWVVSEGQYNYVVWRGITTTSYLIPLGTTTATTSYLPVTFNKTSGAVDNLVISTWTSGSNNVPWAGISDDLLGAQVPAVTNMDCAAIGYDGSIGAVIDRWWDIDASAATTTASVTFSYRGSENTLTVSPTGTLAAQHWTGSAWNDGKGGAQGTKTTTGQVGGTTAATVYTATVAGLTQFTPYILVTDVAPLPVSWLDVSARCNQGDATIKWSTATEQNADFFTVERSADGTIFSGIDNIQASGNSNTVKKYSYIDSDPLPGTSYYRVKETDFNGASMLSSQIVNEDCSSGIEISVFPSPALPSTGLHVVVSGVKDSEVLIVVTDMLGRDFYSKITLISSEEEVIAIDPSHTLAAGVYTVIASSNDQIQKRKIVIQ